MSIFSNIANKLSFNGRGDNNSTAMLGISIGVVVDTDDPLQMGRLRIYCPELNDDPKKVQYLPWASYVSPFGGSINNSSHTKGHDPSKPSTSSGMTQYGFWAIPELGANVLVACIGGDPRRRVYLGCLYGHKETGALFNGVYSWKNADSGPDGPFCAPEADENGNMKPLKPMEPLSTNQSTAFKGNKSSREWKTRAADYSGMSNVDIPNFGTNTQLSSGEKDSWVKNKLGAMGYDWTSFKNLGAYLSAKVFGLMSPGLHAISMDDRPFNSRIRLRTTAGHQIILDDTNERIYVSTYEGKSWIELDKSGNIDIFGERRFSVHAEKDINFSTDESFRVKAKGGIYLYAGDTTGQTPLEEEPKTGEIRMHSTGDLHLVNEKNIYQKVNGNVDMFVGGSFNTFAQNSYKLKIGKDSFALITPRHKTTITNLDYQIDTYKFRMEAIETIQLGIGVTGSQLELSLLSAQVDTILDTGIPESIVIPDVMHKPTFNIDLAEITPWTNRVPEHEPWPRTLKQDSGETVNSNNSGYTKNVDWINQFNDDGSTSGSQPIGVVEGDETITRGEFWRR